MDTRPVLVARLWPGAQARQYLAWNGGMSQVRRLRRFCSRIPLPWWIAAWTVILVAAAGAVWVVCPAWLSGGESASATLRNLGLILAAAIGLPLAIWRSIVAERQADAAYRQSDTAIQMLLNDRFQKGAEMLGNADVGSVRIGGVHALARLASEYPDSFHIPVMQLFSAFVVDQTRGEAAKRVGPAEDFETPGEEEPREPGASDAVEEEEATDRDEVQGFDSARAEFLDHFFAEKRKVGPVHELAQDVKEVMGRIAQRSEGQIALESAKAFRINLAEARLPGLIFRDANFSNIDFTMADLRRALLWGACFTNANLPGADLSAAKIIGADFRGADMRRVNLTAASLPGADLRDANLDHIDLASQNLWKAARFPSRLVGVQLQGADLRGAEFGGADMRGASLAVAKLDAARLGGANLSGADLRAASLKDAKLGGADLSDANLGGSGADLSGAELTAASLAGANLGNADLTGANLADAVVSGADFSRDWRDGTASPARGLTQRQLDQAKAEPASPPILDGVIDPESNKPLVWNGHVA